MKHISITHILDKRDDESEMLKFKNFGRKSLTELVDKLSSMGLHFGMDTSKIMAEEG